MNSLIFVGDATPVEELLKEVIKSTPVAGVLLVVMWLFMRHIAQKDIDLAKSQEVHRVTFERLHAVCDEQQERSGVIISENSKVIGSIDSTLKRFEQIRTK